MKILIVGGVAGGASAAARLRRNSENFEIILFERGNYISFANCGLPYYIGEVITSKEALTLQTPESFNARFNIDVRINSEVVEVDSANKCVTVKSSLSGETYEEGYDKLILSPGAGPIVPSIAGLSEISDGIFPLRNIPDTYNIVNYITEHNVTEAAVIGGGFIGVEAAENLAHRGIKSRIIEMSNQVLPPLDRDMAAEVHGHIEKNGVELMLCTKLIAIEKSGDKFKLTIEKNGESSVIETEMVVLAVGVRPDTAFLSGSKISLNSKGSIIVNEFMETNAPDVYAAGDAVTVKNFVTKSEDFIPLAGPANKQGRIAADNVAGKMVSYDGSQGSGIVKVFDLTVATTGINEKQAKQNGIEYVIVNGYSGSHAGYYPGASMISTKALFEKESGKLLGAQLVGADGVDKRCDVLATVIRLGGTYQDLTRLELCYAPPYGSAKDPVNMVGYIAENIFTDCVKIFHWFDVENLPRDNSIIRLDVRTDGEVARGMIEGFEHITLDELRQNLDKLDKSKPIYVHCQSGLRSYIACRILCQNGFTCYNLSGGYRFFSLVTSDIKRHG